MRGKQRPKSRGAKPAKAKVQAKRASAARDLATRLAESLDQQAATAEILRVIGTSPMDAQPVFDVIARSGVRVCGAHSCTVFVVDEGMVRVAATHGVPAARVERFRTQFPMPLSDSNDFTQVVHERRIFHLADIEHNPAATSEHIENARIGSYRTRLMVPMLRGDRSLGLIAVTAQSPAPFSDQQVALLQTFADQAVIAIENVRLFTELEARNRDLTETLEQQTAAGEILRVISSSPTDIQPVLDTVAASANRLCESFDAAIYRRDGDRLLLAAHHGPIPIASTLPLIRGSVNGRAVLDGRTVHVADIQAEADEFPMASALTRGEGVHTHLSVPLTRDAVAIGTINLRRTKVQPFTERQIALLQTFADQAVIAIENVRLFTELQTSNRDLTTALDQQTATSDILSVISRSQTDVQPVFDAIVASAVRLLGGYTGALTRVAGDQIELAALRSTDDAGDAALRASLPRPLSSEAWYAQVIRDRVPVNIADVQTDPRVPEALRAVARSRGYRSWVVVPLLRHDEAVGTISVTRREPGGFTDDEVALLKTFADQAVIAIENVRLFTELEGRNRDLTATSEILRVISSSPTDVQPVFDTIVRSAVRLCDGLFSALFQFDGEMIRHGAQHNFDPKTLDEILPVRPSRSFMPGRAILERAVVHMPDIELDPEFRYQSVSRAIGFRSGLWVPMLREGNPIGVIAVTRAEPGPFSDSEIALLQTFADQAVIAIENVRMFKELEARNREVTEALEQQTATAEILNVISRSQTNVQPVFDAIVASAVRLLGAYAGMLTRIADDQIEIAALTSTDNPAGDTAVRATFPQSLGGESLPAQLIRDRAPVNIANAQTDPRVSEVARAFALARGYQSLVMVPLLHHDEAVGTIGVSRRETGGFTDDEIALLKTFADQAVIAIENVRLFTELEGRNRDLTATSEILRVISSSPTDVQPVFDTIVRSAVSLCDGLFSAVDQFDGELLHSVAQHNYTSEALEEMHRMFPARPTRALGVGRAILERAVVHIPDVKLDPEYQHPALSRAIGFRSGLFVPMLRGGAPIGVILVARAEPRPFSDSEIELLKTFADQAVIAVENVRLFTELQASNRELTTALDTQTATSDILRVISQSQTNVQPVFDAIVASAVRLLGASSGMLTRVAGDQIVLSALTSTDDAGDAALRAVFPRSLHFEGTHSKVIRDRTPVNIADAHTDPRLSEASRATHRTRGSRSQVVVPLLRHDEAVGTIAVSRREAGGFMDDEMALLKTFADQAVIAIENARLFSELEGRNRDLTATGEILRVISSSPTDVQPVFDTIVGSAVRLCDGLFGALYQFDGELLHLVAQYNYTPEALEAARRVFPGRPSRGGGPGRAILDRAVAHIPDLELDLEHRYPGVARAVGWRSGLFVPMLREGAPIGVIAVTRAEPRPFSNSEIELLKTFADQAVIAVENVRLFKALEARTGELTQSVEKLTALGEVSRAVTSTLDVETVLNTIVSRASQLAGADSCSIFEYDEGAEQFELRATHNDDTAFVEAFRAVPLRKGEGLMGRAVEMREPVQVPDITQPGAYQSSARDTLIRFGYRAVLSVPLLREDQIIGSLSFTRKAPGEFPPEVVDVLKTFATQSALAIQNARLFREIADKSAQLEAASRHKSEFLANMSHELRTPLNAIIGFSEVLNERMFGELNDKQAEYLKDIHASGTHLLSLINDILDLSKVEAGRMELELSDFNLPAAIDSSLTLVRERATRRGITLRSSIHDGIGEMSGDERKIRQVLLNLLSNAIKFTPEGGRIDVAAVPNGGSVEVSVRDTGVGIAPEDHEAVFEEFRQVGASAAKQEGTGLGLALARKFIELHGGKIWVKSQVGVGSTFTFTLPFQRAAGA